MFSVRKLAIVAAISGICLSLFAASAEAQCGNTVQRQQISTATPAQLAPVTASQTATVGPRSAAVVPQQSFNQSSGCQSCQRSLAQQSNALERFSVAPQYSIKQEITTQQQQPQLYAQTETKAECADGQCAKQAAQAADVPPTPQAAFSQQAVTSASYQTASHRKFTPLQNLKDRISPPGVSQVTKTKRNGDVVQYQRIRS